MYSFFQRLYQRIKRLKPSNEWLRTQEDELRKNTHFIWKLEEEMERRNNTQTKTAISQHRLNTLKSKFYVGRKSNTCHNKAIRECRFLKAKVECLITRKSWLQKVIKRRTWWVDNGPLLVLKALNCKYIGLHRNLAKVWSLNERNYMAKFRVLINAWYNWKSGLSLEV